LNREGRLQFVEEGSAAVAKVGSISAVDPVADFCYSHGTQYDWNLSNRLLHTFYGLGRGAIPPLSGNQNAGVEN
jgi:hypothetical protein